MKIVTRMHQGSTGLATFYPGCEELFHRWFNDSRVYLHMGDIDPFPISIEDCKKYVDSHKKDTWLIVAKDQNGQWVPVGYTGLFIRTRHRVGIIRYALCELEYLRKGHAFTAVTMYLGWAFNEGDLELVTASVSGANPESQKLLSKLGFSEVGKHANARFQNGKRYDEIHYEITKKDYYEKIH